MTATYIILKESTRNSKLDTFQHDWKICCRLLGNDSGQVVHTRASVKKHLARKVTVGLGKSYGSLQGVPKKRIPNFIFDHTIKVRWVEEFHVYVP